jgi:hypothetical protein
LEFLASARVCFDIAFPSGVGETPDGVRLDFRMRGTFDGPALSGKFPASAGYLLVDRDGVVTIHARAPLKLDDGAVAELEAVGRYADFGKNGYRAAKNGQLPDSDLVWCPKLLSADPRYAWLNRILPLALGRLRPREARADYDLFARSAP